MEIKKIQTLDVQAVVDAVLQSEYAAVLVLQNEYAAVLDAINGEII